MNHHRTFTQTATVYVNPYGTLGSITRGTTINTNQNDVAIAVANALHNTQGFTGVSAARRLEYIGEDTPPTIVLANWYGSDLSVTVEILAQP